MIDFKKVELSDKKDIDECLKNNTYRACDFCFTNMYAWNAKFKTVFAIKENTLFLRFTETDGKLYYMMPIGKMALRRAFEEIMENARHSGIPFLMKGITARMWKDIEAAMPRRFEYGHDRNNDEYIYLADKLISLSGKKLQSKRNHINRFKTDNPGWEYAPITTPSEVEECLAMLDEWGEEKVTNGDKSIRYDCIATRIMLTEMEILDLRGGCIKVDNKIVAFTVGEKLVADTFVVHVEKALGEVHGAYTIMNQQFIQHEASNFMYVNREEDMGIEPLRKAKLSYYPDILLYEGIIRFKQPEE